MKNRKLQIISCGLAVSVLVSASLLQFNTGLAVSSDFASEQPIRRVIDAPSSTVQWYVAPDGKPKGDGTIKSPWDLATALAKGPSGSEVKAGDTIWLRDGVYSGNFVSDLTGTAAKPVIVRQYPGERAILDKNFADEAIGGLKVRGSFTWYWGFEVSNSYPDRNRLSPAGKIDTWRGSGVNVYGPNNKFINMTLHDNGHAFGLWNEDGGTEIYGCLMYYNGNNKKEHGIYAHNKSGTHVIADNIIFDGAGYGIHVYANNTRRSINGFQIEGNAVFSNGALTVDDQVADQILVGGVTGVPAENIVLRDNYVYNPTSAPTSKNRGVRLGYEDTTNKNVTLNGNYIVSKVPLRVLWWQRVEMGSNTIYSQATSVEVKTPPGAGPFDLQLDRNIYLSGRKGGPVFSFNDSSYDLFLWRKTTGLDLNSQVTQTPSLRPGGVRVFVRPNKYEAGRANIVLFNWDLNERVALDASSVLKKGERYEVRDAQFFFGEPVARGVYDGAPIMLPMQLTRVAQPTGNVERAPSHTTPEFAVFVLRRLD
jgi:hypothetical protein